MFLVSFFAVSSFSAFTEVAKIDGHDVTCTFEENPDIRDAAGTFQIGDGKNPAIKMIISSLNKPEKYTSNFTIPERITHKGKVYILTQIAKFGLSNTNFTNILFNFSMTYSYDYSLVLEKNTFENSTFLEEVNFRFAGIKELPERCFYNCTSLNSIIPGRKLEIFGPMCFAFTNITSIRIGAKITKLGYFLFLGSQIEEVDMEAFPLEIIPFGLFEGCRKITKVKLPTSLKTLPERTFFGSTIKEVIFPAGLTNILEKTFQYCDLLEMVNLSLTDVESLPNECFAHTHSLKTVIFPKRLKTLSTAVFLDSGIEEIVVPEKLSTISDNLFYQCKNLVSVDLSKTVIVSIARSSFYECWKLSTVKLPSTCTKICELAFAATAIASFPFDYIKEIEHNVFTSCAKIVTLDLTKFQGAVIAKETFRSCWSLKEVFFSSKVAFIEEYAFAETNIVDIVLPASIIGLKEGAFAYCRSLNVADFSKTKIKNFPSMLFAYTNSFDIAWPNDVKEITFGDGMFQGSKLSVFRIPKECTGIGERAFASCIDLEVIDLSYLKISKIKAGTFSNSDIREIRFGDFLYEIGNSAFENARVIKFSMPKVSSIGERAFYNFKGIEELNFNEGLKGIGKHAFYMTAVTKVQCPASLESLGSSAFGECKNLQFVNMSLSNVTSIPDFAFCGNPAIKAFYLPYKVTTVSDMAFINSFVSEFYYFGSSNLLFALNVQSSPKVFVAKHYKGNTFNRIKVTKIKKPSYIPNIVSEVGNSAAAPGDDEILMNFETRQIIKRIVLVVSIVSVVCICILIICLCDPYGKKGSDKVEIEHSLNQDQKAELDIGWTKPLSE